MKPTPDHERLLADVLAEDVPGYSRESLLEKTLLLAKRRGRARVLRRRAGILAFLGVVGIFLLWKNPRAVRAPESAPRPSFILIRTQPLPNSAIVGTRQLPRNMLVASYPAVRIVQTDTHGDGLRLLNDRELLALFGSRPAVLVRRGAGAADLIFANPADQNGFPVN